MIALRRGFWMSTSVKDMFGAAASEVRRRAWGVREALHRLGTKVSVRGEGNVLDTRGARLRRVRIEIAGDRNLVRIHPTSNLTGAIFRLQGDDLRVDIGEHVKISQSAEFRLTGRGAAIEVGRNCTIESARLIARNDTTISIGPECMLAYDIEIRTTDSHSILDEATGERINQDQSIQIGTHVWLGARSTVLKGVTIGDESVIATGSVVSRDVEAGVVAGGIPARPLRSGVKWDRGQV